MSTRVEKNFLEQQGYEENEQKQIWFNSLQFQPTIVGSIMLIAIIFQSPYIFLIMSAILWINVLFPAANPFENFYNALIAKNTGQSPIPQAPAPRRFAQGMAAVFSLVAGTSLLLNWVTVAYVAEIFISVAFSALLFGKFCLGAYIYHFLKGSTSFANATCPWS